MHTEPFRLMSWQDTTPFLTEGIGEAAPTRAFLPERSCIADLKVQAALDCRLKEGRL